MLGEFCKCGSMMVSAGDGKLKCRSCGAISSKKASGDIKIKSVSKKQETLVVEKETHLPDTDAECSKCGNKKAYWFVQQTRSSDEPPTRFYRCTKCKHTWREYQ